MDVNRRPNERSVRLALLIAIVVLGMLSAPVMRAQTQPPFSGPSCAAPPASTDTWPTAGVDSLGNTISTKPVTFSAATLLANDIGASLSVTGVSSTSYGGATITGTGPYTYVAAPTWLGNDAFSYTLKDGAGHTTIGVVHVNVIADTVAPTVSITSPANNSSVGGVTNVVASASDNVGVVGVKFFDGATQIGTEDTSSPYSVSWDTSAVALGTHVLTAVARDAAGLSTTSTPISVNVTLTPPATASVDKTVFSDGSGKRTTAAFSTSAAGDVLVAFVGSDGPAGAGSQSVTVSGAGLSWTRVQRAATKGGDSEIWTASAANILTNVTVSSTQSAGGYHQSLTVVAFKGVSGVGASGSGAGANTAPSINLLMQGSGSLVYAVGNDWDRAVARTVPANQTKVHEFVDTAVGDTFWVQSLTTAAGSAGSSVTLNDTAPTNDQWNIAAVELLAGTPPPPPPPPVMVSVPNVVGMTQANAQTAIVGAGLTVGAVTTQSSTSVLTGNVISQSPTGGTAPQGSAVALVVSSGNPPPSQGPVVDASVSSDGTGARTTAAFNTSGPAVLVAFVGTDGPSTSPNNQTVTVSGAGLAWTRAARAAGSSGVAEIWTATAASALSGATVTSTQAITTVAGAAVNQSLTVVAFTSASGIGAVNIGSSASGAPSVGVTTTANNSVVYGVGNDYDQAIARTVPSTQTKVHEFLAPSGDTMWVQALNSVVAAGGTSVTLNDTAPTADQWNFAVVEIKR